MPNPSLTSSLFPPLRWRSGARGGIGVTTMAAMSCALVLLVLLVRELDAPIALGLVVVGAVGGALLLWPELATLLVVFLLYTNIPVLATYQGVPVMAASSFMLLLGLPLVYHVIVRREGLRSDSLFAMMLAFLAVLLIASIGVKGPDLAAAYIMTFVLEGLALYWLVINTVRNRASLMRVIWTLLAAGALLGALPSYQEATGDYGQQFYGLSQRNVEFMQLEQMDMEDPETIELLRNFDGGRARRAEGPMNEPNRFAQILVVLLPLTLHAYRTGRGRWSRLCAAGAGALIMCGIVFSNSRGALVTIVLLVVVAGCVRWIRRSHLAVVALVATLSVPIVAPGYAARVLTLVNVTALANGSAAQVADGAIRGRATEMLAAAQTFLDHPILGVGPGQYLRYYSLEYQQKDPRLKFRDIQKSRRAHSLYVELPAELGLVGLATFLAIFVVLLHRLNRARRRWQATRPELADLATAFAFSLLGWLGTSAFLHLSYQRFLWFLVALASAALHVLHCAERTEHVSPTTAGGARPGARA